MRDIEKEAKALKVAKPSADLDRRVDQLLSGAERKSPRTSFVFQNIPLWGCAAACAIALFTGVLYGRSSAPVEPRSGSAVTLHYTMHSGNQSAGNLFDWTDQEDHFLESASREEIRVSLSIGPKAG